MSSSNLSNPAMFVQARDTKGGIDLNADQMRMDTRVQGEGVEMKVDQAMIERIRHEDFEGLNFSIQSISPITNLPLLLGLSNPIPEVLN